MDASLLQHAWRRHAQRRQIARWHVQRRRRYLAILLHPFLNQPFGHAAGDLNGCGPNVFLRRGLRCMRVETLLGGHALRGDAIHAQIIGRGVTRRSHAMIDDERLHHILLLLRVRGRSRGARQQVARLFAHHHLAVGGREHGQQTDFDLRTTDGVPGNPDAVRRAELGRAEVRCELLRGEDKLVIGFAAVGPRRGIVEAVDGELAFDGHGLIFVVVKVESSTKAAGRRFARRVVHGRGPERDHARRRLIVGFLILGIRIPKLLPTLGERPAFCSRHGRRGAREADDHGEQQDGERCFHDSHP